MKEGSPVPDAFLTQVIKQRVDKLDCKINGFVMEGYPSSNGQIQSLKDIGIVPSHVVVLEISDSKVFERIEHRRFDPVQGVTYNTAVDPPQDEEVIAWLIQSPEDKHIVVKKRLERYK